MHNVKVMEGRTEWLKERKHTIGGSDASAILGVNPWKNNVELWEDKTSDKLPKEITNDAIEFGNNAEPLIRQLFQLEHPEYIVQYVPNNIMKSSEHPFMHASFDGWYSKNDGSLGLLEIKTCTPKNAAGWAEWKDKIPDRYYAQVLHYFAVNPSFVECTLVAYLRHYDGRVEIRQYNILRDDVQFDIEYLIEEEEKFYQSVVSRECPGLKINL